VPSDFSKEQRLFREVVARALKDKSPPEAVREMMASERGFDPTLWEELCGEVGLAGIHVPEALGGAGFGNVELGIVAEEMGRALYCGPYFASAVMAGCALLEIGTEEAQRDLLPGIASGATVATLVLDDLSDPARQGSALGADDQDRLTGRAEIVLDAHVADLLLVVASHQGASALFAVDARAAGIHIEPLQAMDPTRKLCRVTLDGVEGRRSGDADAERLNRVWDRASVTLAHEMIGGAQRLLESTVEYTKVRVQFGRPIGSFQALKHRCADLLMEVELARAVTHHAARCLDSGEGEPYAASMAKAAASDAYMSAARAGIQLRGGIGFTWEDDTHLWFKRAKSSEVFLGTPAQHRERMMRTIEAEA
jgi:alkylation response protein AidB-like acyl-CoA dehydrogenase